MRYTAARAREFGKIWHSQNTVSNSLLGIMHRQSKRVPVSSFFAEIALPVGVFIVWLRKLRDLKIVEASSSGPSLKGPVVADFTIGYIERGLHRPRIFPGMSTWHGCRD
jgi:hypothetical protein